MGGVHGWRSFPYLGAGLGEAYVCDALDTRFDSLAVRCLPAVLPGIVTGTRRGAPAVSREPLSHVRRRRPELYQPGLERKILKSSRYTAVVWLKPELAHPSR